MALLVSVTILREHQGGLSLTGLVDSLQAIEFVTRVKSKNDAVVRDGSNYKNIEQVDGQLFVLTQELHKLNV